MTKTGIRFEVLTSLNTNCLFEVLKCLDDENLIWHITENQTEVWADSDGTEAFSKNEYGNEEFFKLISRNHYAVFVKIQAYPPSCNFYEIHTTEEFISSDCKILILICDGCWCDIYVKDNELLEIIYKDLINSKFDNVNYIYSNDNHRTKLDVL